MGKQGRRGDRKDPEPAGAGKARSTSWWPLYAIGGVILVLVIASALVGTGGPRGNVTLGGTCEETSDCADRRDVCWQVDDSMECVRRCEGEGQSCPPGSTCTSIGVHKRRRSLRVRNLCMPD